MTARTGTIWLKGCLYRLLALCFGLSLSLLLAECGVRVFIDPALWQVRDARADWQADTLLGWTHQPNLDVSETIYGQRITFSTNSDGLLPAGTQAGAVSGRVLLIGDSHTLGRSVTEGDRLHSQLAQMTGYEVINAGVEGYDTVQALLRMERLLPVYRPAIVIYTFSFNDLDSNIQPAAHGIAKPVLVSVDPLQLQAPIAPMIPAPQEYGLEQHIYRSALWRFVAVQRERLQIDARLGPAQTVDAVYYGAALVEELPWAEFAALILRMQTSTEAYGAQLILSHHAEIAEVWSPQIEATIRAQGIQSDRYDRYALAQRLERLAAQQGITFCPVIDHFLAAQGQGPFHLLPSDPHHNGAGFRLQAEALANCI